MPVAVVKIISTVAIILSFLFDQDRINANHICFCGAFLSRDGLFFRQVTGVTCKSELLLQFCTHVETIVLWDCLGIRRLRKCYVSVDVPTPKLARTPLPRLFQRTQRYVCTPPHLFLDCFVEDTVTQQALTGV
jgi:hypothetical protein